ncbi:TetR/AcrR family transcriptional regulator [Dictyobacter formicarum]|uniref:TetR family transcriptional regulator n=1 Tax=Dictyobacter formicarum TaxID=2778368 RepID=A0ABQ3VJ73_9CHLR|nr:TetR/AcrR family transcriptional regulator [Dictyobacter formicarum]GHO85734.1 TetR family transcriptional regulator [Dictyobacter formicarum]
MTAAPSSARQRILDVATDLFYREGIRAIGVDTIVEQSGVGKATLYRHFPTKEDLITAYLDEKEHDYWQQYDEVLVQHEGSPREQLLAFVDTVVARLLQPDYRGCTFLNALAEFSDKEHSVHRHAVEHKLALKKRLLQLSQQAGASDPEMLADQLMLLINGALASVSTFGATGPTSQLKPLATQLIDQQIQP